MEPRASLSLLELKAAGVHLRASEAATIARDVVVRATRGELRGIPSPDVIRFADDGAIHVDGAVAAATNVPRAARLLEALLPGFDAPKDLRVPGALRLVVARALGVLDLPPYASVQDFVAALERFATADPRHTVRAVVARARTAAVPLVAAHAEVAARPLVSSPGRNRARWAAGAAIAAMLAVGALPAVWHSRDTEAPEPTSVATTGESPAQPPVTAAAPSEPVAEAPAPAPPVPEAPAPEAPAKRPAVTTGDLPPASFSPAFATSGSAVFYHSGRGPKSAIMRADAKADGTTLSITRVLADGASNYHPRPSPDGQWIAFDSDRDGVRGVYVARADGSSPQRVSGSGFAAVPSWSPDGKRLAFVRGDHEKAAWNIWVVDLASRAMRKVTNHSVGQPWGASWFPDGKRIAYSHEQRLVVRRLDGPPERVFTTPIAGRLVRTPAVSPDGRTLLFQVFRDGAWLLDLPSGRMRRVLADPTAEEFTWSPDGTRFAFHSRRSSTWGIRIVSRADIDAD